MTRRPDPAAWGLPDCVLEPLTGGARATVFKTRGPGGAHVFKSTTRSEAQVAWVAEIAPVLRRVSLAVALPLPGLDGRYVQDGWTVEPFVPGRALQNGERVRFRGTLRRLHHLAFGLVQRPGFLHARGFLQEPQGGDIDLSQMPPPIVHKCRAAFALVPSEPLTLAHGDLNPTNIAVTPWGQFVIYDWDEARLDHPLFDLVAIGALDNAVPKRAALAFEIATCWQREPTRAMSLAQSL